MEKKTTYDKRIEFPKKREYQALIRIIHLIRIDDDYVTMRNNPGKKNLAHKKIALVGCGTIGGYLAEMLLKAGAGTQGGQLILIDNDDLLPQNIGRHRLGTYAIFSNKAMALQKELLRSMPTADIHAIPVDARYVSLESVDILIDSTGEESLGHWLCGQYAKHIDMLTVWIEGPGSVVRSLLKTSNANACFRCLWHWNREDKFLATEEKISVILEGHGCEELYVPFSSVASVQAACLATDVIINWANHITHPSLRTIIIDQGLTCKTRDCTPEKHPLCPICAIQTHGDL